MDLISITDEMRQRLFMAVLQQVHHWVYYETPDILCKQTVLYMVMRTKVFYRWI